MTLTVRNLSLRIGNQPILSDVSLDVARGEILGLVGESGSGKSLTALSLMGLLPRGGIATGSARLNETEILNLPERRMRSLRGRDIAMVFQEPMTALNPLQTIGDQVAEVARIHGVPGARRLALATLERVGLPPDRFPPGLYPHQLSGGQRQRVVIAMAVILRPALVIADEPTTALDVTTQAVILDLLGTLVREDGSALILITHDLGVVHAVADRVAVMQNGRIVEENDTRTLFADPKDPYTRRLFEASIYTPDRAAGKLGEPFLEARDVRRTYQRRAGALAFRQLDHVAVDDVSFTLHRGESLGLVGESGSGKSTLARAILGLDRVEAGRITLDKQPVSPGMAPELRRRMGAVFQDPYGSFNPRHRVARLLSEPFHLYRKPLDKQARRARVEQALTEVGLPPDAADRHIHAFSGGQRQRIAIARALITRPEVIVLDEAVSALDVSIRATILDLLADLQARHGLSYLFITHDLSVVRSICDRVAVMRNGRIVEMEETGRLFDAPRHPYTKALLSAAPHLPGPG
ncbi:MAG: ABC transporter ATP-binding protein [Rubricella sp.]